MTPSTDDPQGESPTPSTKALDHLAGALEGLRALESFPALQPGDQRTFGRFRLREVLGQGRFGIVFLAEDPRADRPVALKLPQPAVLLEPALAERFRRDIDAVAHLDHPAIVPVLETGCVLGVDYIAMPYVAGPTLAAWLRDHPEGVPVAEAVELVIALADAVQHAHERGVLHCDLKPANVLLEEVNRQGATDAKDETRIEPSRSDLGALAVHPLTPRITDFGLARLLFRPDAATQTYLTAGSPPYMAPEQAQGVRRHLTARCDVHALAAILYELLTGSLPYVGEEADRLRQLLDPDVHPRSPRSIRHALPRDLEAIVLKGLEKDPARRYDSALALANDLRRFREGRPTRARPVGPLGQAARWTRRHPFVAPLVAACLMATGVATWLGVRLGYQALLHRQELEQQEFYAVLERVRQRRLEQPEGWADDNLADLRRLAALAPADDFQPLLCSEAAVALAAPRLRQVGEVGVGKNAYVCAYSPDGQVLALGERFPVLPSDELRVWLVRTTGEEVGELRYPTDVAWERRHGDKRSDGARSLAYSPDGRWLVLGTRGGRLVRWDLHDGATRPVVWEAHVGDGKDHTGDEVRALVFNRDGSVLLSGSHGRIVRRWDTRDGWKGLERFPALLPIGSSTVRETAWVQQQRDTFVLRPFDLRTGRSDPQGEAAYFYRFCQSLDGGRLGASAQNQFGIAPSLVCPEEPNAQRALADPTRPEQQQRVTDLVLPPASRWLWSGSEANTRLDAWDTVGGKLAASIRLRGGSARLASHPGGRQVAVCEEGRTLLFESREGAVCRTLVEDSRVESFALSADGERLVTTRGSLQGRLDSPGTLRMPVTVYRRTPDGFAWLRHLRPQSNGIRQSPVALDPKGTGLVLAVHAHREGNIGLLTLDGRWIATGDLHDVQFGPDGRVWAATVEGKLLCWSGKGDATVVSTVPAEEERAGVGFTAVKPGPTGTLAGRRDGKVEWFDVQARRLATWDLFTDQEVSCLATNADGSEALVGGSKGAVARLALPSGEVIRPEESPHADTVVGLAYLGGGTTLTASADQAIRLWDRQGRMVLALREAGPIARAELSPGGDELYVLVRGEWGLRVWNLADLSDSLRDLGLDPGYSASKAVLVPAALPQGLVAEAFRHPDYTDLVGRWRDPQIDFDWGSGCPSPLAGPEAFSVRWTGWLRALTPGAWEFQLDCDDIGTAWIDGRVVLEAKQVNGTPPPKARVLLPDQPVSFRLDYTHGKGRARGCLSWRPAGSKEPFVPVPPKAFTPD